MNSNYLNSVPRLKGRENYDEWSFAAESLLVLDGMEKYVKPPTGFDIKPAEDAKTRAKLILTVDPTLYVHIRNTETSAELWSKLKNMFDDSGFSRKISLLRHLISIRLDNCDSMTTYVTQMVETAQRLNGTGFTITEEWVGSLLLAGLPDHYSPMIMAIEHSGIPISTDVIKSKLLDMEVTKDEASGTAFVARNFNKQKTNSGASASSQKTVTATDRKTKEYDGRFNCFKCKKSGHYKRDCPLLKKTADKCVFNVVFINGKFNKTEWYVDSGASAHMTVNKDWIMNMNMSPPCFPEIVVANESKVSVECSGDVEIVTDLKCHVTVKNVLCVPRLTTNLLSVSELIRNGNNVVFDEKHCHIYDRNGALVARADLIDGVYKLRLQSPSYILAAPAVTGGLWHRRKTCDIATNEEAIWISDDETAQQRSVKTPEISKEKESCDSVGESCVPEGFANKSGGNVLRLKRAIYGLKQSSLAWYERVKDCLCKLGFNNSQYEPCVFAKTKGNVKLIIGLDEDDFLIFSNNYHETQKLKNVLASEFKLKDLGPVRQNVRDECIKVFYGLVC